MKGKAAELELELQALGSVERAAEVKRYLKSDLDFFGTPLGDIRACTKRAIADLNDRTEPLALAEELWSVPIHERRTAAVVILEQRRRSLEVDDLQLIERFLRESKTWALVDGLAVGVVGSLVERYPTEVGRTMDRWSEDDDFWIRRSALLSQLDPLKKGAPFAAFSRYADAMLDSREFFIRKAIGWVLRDVSKKRPDEVWDWIAPRAHRASGVTIREVVKYLPPERSAAILDSYKAKTPIV
jgi:3-methyladenine DNA glycosylase AlkD